MTEPQSTSTAFTVPGNRWDRLGVALSTLCLIHCLGLSLFALALPVLAAELLSHQLFHGLIFALALPTAALALWRGRRRHGGRLPAALAFLGLLLLAAAISHGWHGGGVEVERGVTMAGGVALIAAHLLNAHRCHGRDGCRS